MRSISNTLFSVIILLSASWACKDQLPTQQEASSIVLPDKNLSFSKDIEPLFTARCISCHSGAYAPDLTPPSYSALSSYQPQLFVSGEGNSSLLLQLLDGRTQPAMPPTGSRLTQNQLNGIKQWIDEGAQNN